MVWLSRAFLLLFAVCTGVAMARYPGGDAFGGREPGYSQARNYFCDLTAPMAHDGRANGGVRWAQAGVVLFALAVITFWGARASRGAGKLDRTAARLGIAGGLGMLLLPVGRPHIAGHDLHPVITLGAATAVTAAAVLAVASARRKGLRFEAALGALAIGSAAVTAAIYVVALAAGTEPTALPIAQKVAAVPICAWILVAVRG